MLFDFSTRSITSTDTWILSGTPSPIVVPVFVDIDGRGGQDIQALTIPNATLVSESISASDNGSAILNLNYIGHGF